MVVRPADPSACRDRRTRLAVGGPGQPDDGALVDRLERLAALRRRGDLTNEEYETAKAATLAEAGRRPMNGSFQPAWLRVAVIVAAIAGDRRGGVAVRDPRRRAGAENRPNREPFPRSTATYTPSATRIAAPTEAGGRGPARARRASAAGDHDAFAVLAGTFVARLDAAARLILRDHELARDAVQEGFLRAWRDLPTLRDPDRFEAWLRSLVFHSCIDVLRRRGRRPIEVELLPIDGPAVADIAVGRRRPRPARRWRSGASDPNSARSSSCTTTSGCRCPKWRRRSDPDRDRQVPPPSVTRADARRDRCRPGDPGVAGRGGQFA